MTKNRNQKQQTRAQQSSTGSSYSAARRQLSSRKCQRCNNTTRNPSGLCYLHDSTATMTKRTPGTVTAPSPAITAGEGAEAMRNAASGRLHAELAARAQQVLEDEFSDDYDEELLQDPIDVLDGRDDLVNDAVRKVAWESLTDKEERDEFIEVNWAGGGEPDVSPYAAPRKASKGPREPDDGRQYEPDRPDWVTYLRSNPDGTYTVAEPLLLGETGMHPDDEFSWIEARYDVSIDRTPLDVPQDSWNHGVPVYRVTGSAETFRTHFERDPALEPQYLYGDDDVVEDPLEPDTSTKRTSPPRAE